MKYFVEQKSYFVPYGTLLRHANISTNIMSRWDRAKQLATLGTHVIVLKCNNLVVSF